MAHVKKGQTVTPPQWWKHLRGWKRDFWSKQRQADKVLGKAAADEYRAFVRLTPGYEDFDDSDE